MNENIQNIICRCNSLLLVSTWRLNLYILHNYFHFAGRWIANKIGWFGLMCNATFNNISVISWPSVLLVEEPGVPGENHLSVASRIYFEDTKWVIRSRKSKKDRQYIGQNEMTKRQSLMIVASRQMSHFSTTSWQ